MSIQRFNKMNTLRYTDTDYPTKVEGLTRASSLFDPAVENKTRKIIGAVREKGDAALIEFTNRFDGANVSADRLAVSPAELSANDANVDPKLRKAVAAAFKNVQDFCRESLRGNWRRKNTQGAWVGEKFDPFQRVGIYVPGGHAPLISTALMTVVLANTAGCPEVAVCTPCNERGEVNPAVLYALKIAGATEIYRIGGAQAIAALTFGTKTIRRVQKIFGPGNAYVVTAKRLVFGHVAIDLLPGPSEGLVLADDTAHPKFIAADMLAQAEHGSGHERVWLVTPSKKLLSAVKQEISEQLPRLKRKESILRALANNGWLILVKNLSDGIKLTNAIAPEHCEIMTARAAEVSAKIITAGAIFLGNYSATVFGDYLAGPSHVLPTGGAGAGFSGLTVDQFQRRTSVVEYDLAAVKKSLSTIETFAEMEGLEAHGHSAICRAFVKKDDRKSEK